MTTLKDIDLEGYRPAFSPTQQGMPILPPSGNPSMSLTPYPDLDDEAPRGGAIVWLLVADALALLCGALAGTVWLIRAMLR